MKHTLKISIIAAVAGNLAIGKENDLLCYVPGDLKRFKEITGENTVIMGRKTWESLPQQPLPRRRNIVISSDKNYVADGAEVFSSVEEALRNCHVKREVFVIGGGSVYAQTIDKASHLYLTWIDHDFTDADTFFPEIDFSEWRELFREEYAASELCPYSFAFVDYVRI